ncbi:MAG: hypothetical protein ABIH20_00905 [Candidatus Diapherotrites archaeon]
MPRPSAAQRAKSLRNALKSARQNKTGAGSSAVPRKPAPKKPGPESKPKTSGPERSKPKRKREGTEQKRRVRRPRKREMAFEEICAEIMKTGKAEKWRGLLNAISTRNSFVGETSRHFIKGYMQKLREWGITKTQSGNIVLEWELLRKVLKKLERGR